MLLAALLSGYVVGLHTYQAIHTGQSEKRKRILLFINNGSNVYCIKTYNLAGALKELQSWQKS